MSHKCHTSVMTTTNPITIDSKQLWHNTMWSITYIAGDLVLYLIGILPLLPLPWFRSLSYYHLYLTYYSIMIKQGKDVNGTIRPVAPVIIQSEAAVPPSPFFLSAIFPVFRAMLRPLHLAEDSFRLYSLMKTFLI